jgi:hypothetical protein
LRGFSRRIAGGLNAVCNGAGTVDKASDRKLRSALYIQATQVTGDVGAEETRELAVSQVDTDPAVAGDRRLDAITVREGWNSLIRRKTQRVRPSLTSH